MAERNVRKRIGSYFQTHFPGWETAKDTRSPFVDKLGYMTGLATMAFATAFLPSNIAISKETQKKFTGVNRDNFKFGEGMEYGGVTLAIMATLILGNPIVGLAMGAPIFFPGKVVSLISARNALK